MIHAFLHRERCFIARPALQDFGIYILLIIRSEIGGVPGTRQGHLVQLLQAISSRAYNLRDVVRPFPVGQKLFSLVWLTSLCLFEHQVFVLEVFLYFGVVVAGNPLSIYRRIDSSLLFGLF